MLERNSLGLAASKASVELGTTLTRTGGVVYWCARDDFDAIGGFDEAKFLAEDIDFATRLRRHGKATGRRFRNLRRSPATVSTRKFDRYRDWHFFLDSIRMLCHPRKLRAISGGTDTSFADEYFYDFNG